MAERCLSFLGQLKVAETACAQQSSQGEKKQTNRGPRVGHVAIVIKGR